VEDSLSGINPDDVTVTVECKTPPPEAACAGSFDSEVESGGKVLVTVQYRYDWVTPVAGLVGLGDGVDLEKTVEMRVE
jgi:hypothetical protein